MLILLKDEFNIYVINANFSVEIRFHNSLTNSVSVTFSRYYFT